MKNLIPVLFALVFICSCSKQGTQGPAGTSGANNIATYDVTIPANGFTVNNDVAFANITVPAITQNILDSGSVQVFQLLSNSGQAYQQALPYSNTINGNITNVAYYVQPGILQIDYQYNAPANNIPVAQQFKVVVITGR